MEDNIRATTSIRWQPSESGWGWVVCITVMLCYDTVNMFLNTTSILHAALMKEFGEGNEDSSWVGVLVLCTSFLFCSVAGILSDRFGIRQVGFAGGVLTFVGILSSAFVTRLELLYFTIGIVVGTGSSCLFTLCPVILGHYFKKRLGLVNGLMTLSAGVTTVIFSLLLPTLLDALGWKKTLLCVSAMNFLLMLYPLTWVPVYHRTEDPDLSLETGNNMDNHIRDQDHESCSERQPILRDQDGRRNGLLNVRIWQNRHYVIFVIANAIANFGYLVSTFHIVKYSEDLFPDENAHLLNMFYAVAQTSSRGLLILVADLPRVQSHYTHIQQLALFVLGFTTVCLSLASNYVHLVVATILIGICDGVFFMLLGPVIMSMVTVANASQGMGFYLTIISIPHGIGIVVAAAMYDYYGTYNLAFQVLSIPILIGALLMFLIDLP